MRLIIVRLLLESQNVGFLQIFWRFMKFSRIIIKYNK